MTHSQPYLTQPESKSVLLSIKPRFADLILAGEKRVEFRRTWASSPVKMMAIYSSSPVKSIVGLVEIEDVTEASPQTLWTKFNRRGAGLPRKELLAYYEGKSVGYAVLLGKVYLPKKPLTPESIFTDFYPPQSFRYLTATELKKLEKKVLPKEGL